MEFVIEKFISKFIGRIYFWHESLRYETCLKRCSNLCHEFIHKRVMV